MIASILASYLVAWLSVAAIVLGAVPLVLLSLLTGGAWSSALRAPLRAVVATMPWLALAFLPIAFGLSRIYPWARDPGFASGYLDTPFFIARSVAYFAIWIAMSAAIRRVDPVPSTRAKRWSALGLLVHLLIGSLAAVDWIMSLTPQWHSTTFGLLVITSQMLGALAFAVALRVRSRDRDAQTLGDFGNLLLAFVMMWAYLAYTQYLIVWIGNLSNDIDWYLPRARTSWRALAVVVFGLRFAVPLVLLLSRANKRDPVRLEAIAWGLAATQLVESAWLVLPTLRPTGFDVTLADALAIVVLAVAWQWLLRRGPADRPHGVDDARA